MFLADLEILPFEPDKFGSPESATYQQGQDSPVTLVPDGICRQALQQLLGLFDAQPIANTPQVAIVNETFANRNFAGRSAIGAQFKFGNTGDKGNWYRIVGVVKEIHEVGMGEATRPAVYLLHLQGNNQLIIPPGGIAVRTAVEPASIVSAIRQAMWSIDKNQPMWRVQTLETYLPAN